MAKTLSSGVAHLINNEMLGIIGRAEMVQFRLKNSRDLSDIEKVIALAMKASEYAKKLVSYTQSTHQKSIKMNVFDTLFTVVNSFQKGLPFNIELHMRKPDFPMFCYGDEVEIASVFNGVLENGKEAIIERWENSEHQTTGHLTISFREESDPQNLISQGLVSGNYVCISFADNGCGISQDITRKIFEPFMTTKFEGRGLGLAAAYGALQSHGGHIEVESDVGKGTLFHIWLPKDVTGREVN